MRFWRQVVRDIYWLEQRIKATEGVMKVLTLLGIAAVFGLGLSAVLGKVWWLNKISGAAVSPATIALAIAALALFFYFGVVFARSRAPMLAVGKVVADLRETSHQFQLEVKNLGPGSVRPRVRITKATDGLGVLLSIGFSGWEAHWRRGVKDERPLLEEGEPKQAGIVYVKDGRLWSFELDHSFRQLWDSEPPRTGTLLTVTVACQPEGSEGFNLQTERTYHFKQDPKKPLGFSVKRVRFRWLGIKWRTIRG